MSGQIPLVNPAITIQTLTVSPSAPDAGQVPNAIANLAPGTLVEGFVVNRNAQQQPILRTSLGDILVQSELFLKTGSQVVIRIDPSVNGRARIITVDGADPQTYAQQLAGRTITKDTILPSSITSDDAPTGAALSPQNAGTAQNLRAVLLPAPTLPHPTKPRPILCCLMAALLLTRPQHLPPRLRIYRQSLFFKFALSAPRCPALQHLPPQRQRLHYYRQPLPAPHCRRHRAHHLPWLRLMQSPHLLTLRSINRSPQLQPLQHHKAHLPRPPHQLACRHNQPHPSHKPYHPLFYKQRL